MANLKPGWKRVKFGEVVRLVKETCKDPVAAGIDRVIGLEHLEPGDLRVRTWNDIADGTTFTTRVRPGQVLFGKRRAYQRKVAVADFDAICSGDIYVFETANPQRLLPELLPFLCQTEAFFEYAVGTSAGSLSPRTNWSSLAEYEFALPPLEEQRRISEAVQEINRAIYATSAVLESTKELEFSITHNSFMGYMDTSPVRPLNDGCVRITDGTHQPPIFTETGVPFFLVKTISRGYVDWGETKFVSQATYQALTRRVQPKRGDVIYTAVGATYGIALFVDFDQAFVFQRHIAHIIPNSSILLGEYIEAFLNSPMGKRQSDQNAIGSAQPTVTLGSLSQFKLPFPSLETQATLVERLRQVRASQRATAGRVAELVRLGRLVLQQSFQ